MRSNQRQVHNEIVFAGMKSSFAGEHESLHDPIFEQRLRRKNLPIACDEFQGRFELGKMHNSIPDLDWAGRGNTRRLELDNATPDAPPLGRGRLSFGLKGKHVDSKRLSRIYVGHSCEFSQMLDVFDAAHGAASYNMSNPLPCNVFR